MASNSGWSKGLPSGTSNIALGDNDIRSNQSVVQAAFEDEHYFTDGSANSAGVHKAGSARAWSQAAAPTAVNPIGQLWHDSDTDDFYVAEAAGTGSWTTIFGRLPRLQSSDVSYIVLSNAAETTVSSVTIPASYLGSNGDFAEATFSGIATYINSNMTLVVQYLNNSSSTYINASGPFTFTTRLTRISSASVLREDFLNFGSNVLQIATTAANRWLGFTPGSAATLYFRMQSPTSASTMTYDSGRLVIWR